MNDIAELVRAAVGDRGLRSVNAEKALYRNITDDLIDADKRVRRGEGYHGFPCWDLYRCAIAQDYTTLRDLRYWTVAFAFAFAEDGAIRSDARDPDLITAAAWDALHFVLHKRWVLTVRDVGGTSGRRQRVYGRFRKALARRLLAALDDYTNELQYQLRRVVRINKGCKLYSGDNLKGVGEKISQSFNIHSGNRITPVRKNSDRLHERPWPDVLTDPIPRT